MAFISEKALVDIMAEVGISLGMALPDILSAHQSGGQPHALKALALHQTVCESGNHKWAALLLSSLAHGLESASELKK
jgi:hypothetical protein